MTYIDRINITDFKGLRSLEVEPNQVNIITGRNNTGKTSVLEASQLGLSPEQLSGYEQEASDLINFQSESTTISIKNDEDEITLQLRLPTYEEALKYYSETVIQAFSAEEWFSLGEELDQTIKNALQNILNTADPNSIPNLRENVLLVQYNDQLSRYVNITTEVISPLLENNRKDLFEDIDNEIDNKDKMLEDTPFDNILQYTHFCINFDSYFFNIPEGPNDVTFINKPIIEEPPDVKEESNTAVKKVEIRDYLNDHSITPEPNVVVEDFDFDNIVLEKDGEKHQIPYNFMGDGFKTIVGILWEFLGEEEVSDVILMEEPENNMHPGYVSQLVPFLLNVAKKEDIQLFITTHNIDFISEFMSDIPPEKEEFIEENFKLIQMSESLPKVFDYQTAKEQVEDLHLDLRGV